MPKKRNNQDALEAMSTEQLHTFLEQSLHDDSDSDLEEALLAARILAERGGELPEEFPDTRAAWNEFCSVYRPFRSDPTPLWDLEQKHIRPRGRRRIWLPSLSGAAAAIAILVGLACLSGNNAILPTDPYQQLTQWNSRFIRQVQADDKDSPAARSGKKSDDTSAEPSAEQEVTDYLDDTWNGTTRTSPSASPEAAYGSSDIRVAGIAPEPEEEEPSETTADAGEQDAEADASASQGNTGESGAVTESNSTETTTEP